MQSEFFLAYEYEKIQGTFVSKICTETRNLFVRRNNDANEISKEKKGERKKFSVPSVQMNAPASPSVTGRRENDAAGKQRQEKKRGTETAREKRGEEWRTAAY